MPNLVGVIDASQTRERLEAILGRMMDSVDIPAFGYVRRSALAEGVAVGNVLTGVEDNSSQPARAPGMWLMLDGEILEVEELKRDLVRRGVETTGLDDAGLALAAYRALGDGFLEALGGSWNLVLHDESKRQTVLACDRLGSRVLYFAEDGRRFTFASEVKGVVSGRPGRSVPGGSGMLQLLMSHAHFGAATWIEGIEIVEPGTVLRFGRDDTKRSRWARLRFRETGASESEDDLADALHERLKAATARAMKGSERMPLAITLSGGLDSRALLLSIEKKRLPITSITYGDPDSGDVRYARELAHVVGTRHMYIEEHRPRLEAAAADVLDRVLGPLADGRRGFYGCQVDRIAWRSEGMTNFAGLSSMIWHPVYAKEMRLALNGACGDALTGSHLDPALLVTMSRAALIARMQKSVLWQSRELVEEVLDRRFLARWWDSLGPAFAATFREIASEHPMAISSVWDMENRQRRGAFSSFTIERYFCTVRAPFIDRAVVDLLADVPPMWRFQQRLYKRMIVRSFPEARQVPWAAVDGPITADPLFEIARATTLFAIRQLRARLPAKGTKKRAWDFRDVVRLLREDSELSGSIERWTRSEAFPSSVFDAAGVRRFVERFRRGEGGHPESNLFAHLCVLSRLTGWLCGDRVPRIPPEADPSTFGVVPVALGKQAEAV
jgi:asparagine synthase (glutamine-hydrolysing)